ncbi:MAG: DUF432 domain-containing protein [Nitrososphaeraceae archaeon]
MLETSNRKGVYGCHSFPFLDTLADNSNSDSSNNKDFTLFNFRDHKISLTPEGESIKSGNHLFRYKRYLNNEVVVDKLLTSSSPSVNVCIFPAVPLYSTPDLSRHLYLKFKSPFVVDPHQKLDFYAKMPIEIGIFKESHKKGILLIDCISLCKQQYILYGTPEHGAICRYKETEVYTAESETAMFEEALIGMHMHNDTDKIIQINMLVIPLNDVMLEHRNDNAYLSGKTEIKVGSSFGKDIANVQLINAKTRDSQLSQTPSKEVTQEFLMDSGF